MGKGTRKVRICRIPASIGHSGEMFYAMLFAKNYVGTTLVVVQISGLKARNIIRRAYGYRDGEYMKLKIIQACSSLSEFRPWSFSFNNSS